MFARRDFLRLTGGASAAAIVSSPALALDYPNRPVHWIDDTAPGGSGDIVARLLGQQLSEQLGQPFIIDNRPGGSGEIGMEAVARAPADGYTLFVINSVHPTHALLFPKTNFDFDRDFEAIAGLAIGPLVMLVHPSTPVSTLAEFLAYAKANPGKVNFASVGNGSPPHLAGELFKMLAGVDLVHVPYRGGALAVTDLLAGHVQVMFTNLPAHDYVKSGALRALAVTTKTRSPSYPDLPAIAELVPGYDTSVWFGAGVRKGTPPEIVATLDKAIGAALDDPKVKSGLAVLDATPMRMSPDEMKTMMAGEMAKWAKVIKAAHIEPQ